MGLPGRRVYWYQTSLVELRNSAATDLIFKMYRMKKLSLHCVLLGFLCQRAVAADTGNLDCFKSADFWQAPEAGNGLHYAPDREVTVLHLALVVTPDFKQRTVAGTATLKFKPNITPARELKLDAVDLKVESVTATEKIQAWQVTKDHLVITFAQPIPAGHEASVSVVYHAQPELGLYFRTPEMGYKAGDTHCFSQGEEIEARHWYPCFDSPNEKFTSEVTCLVPPGMTAVSNGRLVSQITEAKTGLTAFHWSQEQPHANYLITLTAGYFKELDGKHKDVPLAFLTPPSEFKEAVNSFGVTDEIMGFLEQEIGVPFPWAKYDQICVNDFVAGGMENTSATTLTDATLFTAATENLHDSESLVAHEMAHQWFGDLVTCKDWSHVWLNEGFATYYQVLYNGWKNGHDAELYDLYGNARNILAQPNDSNPIVRRNYGIPFEMFNYLAYPKGGWVLHMLRAQLGADLYRQCIKTYLDRHRYGNVTTEDLRAVIEELSGRSYDQFFDQWVYHAHYPELSASYSWDETSRLAKISVRQTQTVGDNVRLFDVPLTIRFKGDFGTNDQVVEIKEAAGDFYFPLASRPASVRLDPEYTLLAKVDFRVPDDLLRQQLVDKTDLIGRLLAVQALADNHDAETVASLKATLNTDPFYGVRLEAARALRTIHTDEALAALEDSGKQIDARVRRAVVMALGGFFQDSAGASLLKVLANEKNPGIQSEALRGLAPYGQPEIHDLLIKYLNSDSYRQQLAAAAITAMRGQDDPAYIAPLQEALQRRQAELPTRTFAQGLSTLAYLARNEAKRGSVREYLVAQVNDKRETVQREALAALGTLGDPKAVAVLATFAEGTHDGPLHDAAQQAITTLRADRKPVDDYKALRGELLELQKANRSLQKDFEAFQKKSEARNAGGPGQAPKTKEPAGHAGNPTSGGH